MKKTIIRGDIKLNLLRFKELQSRIQESGISEVLVELRGRLSKDRFSAKECIDYCAIPKAYCHLQKYKEALPIMLVIWEKAQKLFPKESNASVNIDRLLGEIYLHLKEYEKAKEFFLRANNYYRENGDENSYECILKYVEKYRIYICTNRRLWKSYKVYEKGKEPTEKNKSFSSGFSQDANC